MDALLMAGLLDSPTGQELLAAIRTSYDQRIAIERQSLADDLAALDRDAARLGGERAARKQEAQALRASIAVELAAFEKSIGDRDAAQQRSRLMQVELMNRRGTYPLRLLEQRIANHLKMKEGINSHLVEVERQRLEAEKAAFELARQRRELNKEEYDRRVKSLEEQQAVAASRLKTVEAMLNSLRSLGVTRTTGGFLSWAGYVSFAGLGWLVGEFIHRLAGKPGGMVTGLFQLLVNSYTKLVAQFGFLGGLLALVLLPFFVGGLGFIVLWIGDKFLRKIDPNWEKKKGAAKQQPKRKEKGPWTLVSGGATEVDRKYYLQWLAKVPVYVLALFLVSVVAVLFNLGRGDLTPGAVGIPGALPFQAGLYTFAGVALCILVTCVLILYVTRVVEIRSPVEADGGRRPMPLDRELKVLGVALLVLFAGGIALALAPALRGSLALVYRGMCLAVAVTAAGFVTACGLIYKGLTRDLDALRREVEQFETEIERFAQWPVLAPATDVDQYRQDLVALYDEIAKLWRDADYWHLPAEGLLAATGLWQPPTVEPASDPSSSRPSWRPSWWSKPDPARPRISVDELLEPKLIGDILSALIDASSVGAEVQRRQERLAQQSARLRQLEAADQDLVAPDLEQRKADLERSSRQRVAALELEKAADIGKYEASYRAGHALRGSVTKPFPKAA